MSPPSATHPYALHGFKFSEPCMSRFATARAALEAAMDALDTSSFAVTRITREGRMFMSDDEIVTEWLRRKSSQETSND